MHAVSCEPVIVSRSQTVTLAVTVTASVTVWLRETKPVRGAISDLCVFIRIYRFRVERVAAGPGRGHRGVGGSGRTGCGLQRTRLHQIYHHQ